MFFALLVYYHGEGFKAYLESLRSAGLLPSDGFNAYLESLRSAGLLP